MTPASPDRAPVLAYASLGAIVALALMIMGIGALSFATDTDPISGGFGGALAVVLALLGWVIVILAGLRRTPGLGLAALAALAAGGGYLVGAFLGDIGEGLVAAMAALAHAVTAWFAVVVAVAGLLAATGVAVAWRGRGGERPRWPWEGHDDTM